MHNKELLVRSEDIVKNVMSLTLTEMISYHYVYTKLLITETVGVYSGKAGCWIK